MIAHDVKPPALVARAGKKLRGTYHAPREVFLEFTRFSTFYFS